MEKVKVVVTGSLEIPDPSATQCSPKSRGNCDGQAPIYLRVGPGAQTNHKYLLVIALCSTLLSPALGGNLLALHFVATGSYIRIMDGVLQTLAPHNNITLYSIVHEEPPHPNIKLIKVKAPQPTSFFFSGLFDYLCTHGTFYMAYKVVQSLEDHYIEGIFADQNVKDLFRTKEKYDALITFSTFSEFTIQFSHLFKIPLIEISAPLPFMHINDAIGNPLFLTTIHSFYDVWPGFNFFERVLNYMKNVEVHLRYNYHYLPQIEQITTKYFPPGTPQIAEVHRNTSLLIVNVNNAMGYARPNMPNVVHIGGIHCRPPRPLDKDLEDFINGSGEHGIIYFSFGSSIRAKFPEYITEAIVRVFAKLPQRILWKWNEEISNLPPNVKMSKWFSQQDILGHNKTKLFITQSGMFSMQETAFHGVPVLAIPIAFDQPMNAIIAHKLGYCEFISFCNFSEDKFYELIQKLIAEPKYKNNVKKISKLMTDYPMSSKEQLVWWVDYIVRHNGNPMVTMLKDKSYGFVKLDLDVVTFLYFCITIGLVAFVYLTLVIKKYIETLSKTIIIKKKSD